QEDYEMDEDWGLVKNDCLLFSPSLNDDHLLIHPSDSLLSLNSDEQIKLEPEDRDSDYHTSSSNSPSSLCDSAGVCEYSPLILNSHPSFTSTNHHGVLHSPSSSNGSHSLSMQLGGDTLSSSMGNCLSSPLPPVSHFSHYTHHSHPSPTMDHVYGMDDRSMHNLIIPKEEISSQMECLSSGPSSPVSPVSPSPIDPLYHHRLQIRTRSKMHEMALHHRLITEQDPRGSGHVQLSAEEKRTLIQEGYSIPSKLPLTKAEEEALRIVRRKIKNKLSAQESRRKRKEYIDTLEQRCQVYASENANLKQRLKQMEAQLRKANGRV
ncbi:crh-2, partial [Pristionchus pacificus]